MTIKYADIESVLAALMETERQLTQVRAKNERLRAALQRVPHIFEPSDSNDTLCGLCCCTLGKPWHHGQS